MPICHYKKFVSTRSEDWEQLYQEKGVGPDQSLTWVDALVNAHDIEQGNLRVLFGEEMGRITWLLPCIYEKSAQFGFARNRLRSTGTIFGLHFEVLSRLDPKETAAQVLQSLHQLEPKWTDIQFDKLVLGSALVTGLSESASAYDYYVDATDGETPPYLEISECWDDYLLTKTSNFRYNLKRKAKKLKQAGNIEIAYFEEGSGWPDVFDDIENIERKSWKHDAGTSLRHFEQAFYPDLVSRCTEDIKPFVSILKLDNVPIAYDLSIIAKNKGYCLKTSFRGDHSRLSPGNYLRSELLRQLFQKGLSEYDFLGDNESYKLQWATDTRRHLNLRITKNVFSALLRRKIRLLKTNLLNK